MCLFIWCLEARELAFGQSACSGDTCWVPDAVHPRTLSKLFVGNVVFLVEVCSLAVSIVVCMGGEA